MNTIYYQMLALFCIERSSLILIYPASTTFTRTFGQDVCFLALDRMSQV